MMCLICKTGQTTNGHAAMTFIEGTCTIVVKDVPAMVCTTCGEEYVDEATARRLSDLVQEAAAQGVEIDVRRFEAA